MLELPSIVYLPAVMGLLCYIILPMTIIFELLLASLYFALAVRFPWTYLYLAGISLPLSIVSLSVKAYAFWNYWRGMLAREGTQKVGLE
jgi:hypothetical protein